MRFSSSGRPSHYGDAEVPRPFVSRASSRSVALLVFFPAAARTANESDLSTDFSLHVLYGIESLILAAVCPADFSNVLST